MRVDLAPIVKQAEALLAAIEAKQRGPARDAAHRLMCALPIPSWADPAPGVTVMYGIEFHASEGIEMLRYSAARWSLWLHDNGEPGDEWPPAVVLGEATHLLEAYVLVNN